MWLFLWLAVQLGSTKPSVSGLAMGQSQFPSLVVENPDAYAQQHSLEIDEGKKDQNYMSKPTIAVVQTGDLKVILSETWIRETKHQQRFSRFE